MAPLLLIFLSLLNFNMFAWAETGNLDAAACKSFDPTLPVALAYFQLGFPKNDILGMTQIKLYLRGNYISPDEFLFNILSQPQIDTKAFNPFVGGKDISTVIDREHTLTFQLVPKTTGNPPIVFDAVEFITGSDPINQNPSSFISYDASPTAHFSILDFPTKPNTSSGIYSIDGTKLENYANNCKLVNAISVRTPETPTGILYIRFQFEDGQPVAFRKVELFYRNRLISPETYRADYTPFVRLLENVSPLTGYCFDWKLNSSGEVGSKLYIRFHPKAGNTLPFIYDSLRFVTNSDSSTQKLSYIRIRESNETYKNVKLPIPASALVITTDFFTLDGTTYASDTYEVGPLEVNGLYYGQTAVPIT